jgi:hypothetical protein
MNSCDVSSPVELALAGVSSPRDALPSSMGPFYRSDQRRLVEPGVCTRSWSFSTGTPRTYGSAHARNTKGDHKGGGTVTTRYLGPALATIFVKSEGSTRWSTSPRSEGRQWNYLSTINESIMQPSLRPNLPELARLIQDVARSDSVRVVAGLTRKTTSASHVSFLAGDTSITWSATPPTRSCVYGLGGSCKLHVA